MAWDESKHPRNRLGRFTDAYGAYRQNASYGEILAAQKQQEVKVVASEKDDYSDIPTVKLPRAEYAMVMHELATNLTEDEREQRIITRNIRNHTYVVVNNGFGNYRVIKKKTIKSRR